MWQRLKHCTSDLFETFWAMASPEAPKLDYSLVDYVRQKDKDGVLKFGMKNRETGKLHGIVRMIEPYSGVYESTFKNGKNHGLSRAVFDDQVSIVLFKDGLELARFHFDKDFVETGRHDPVGFLINYNPLFFRKTVE